MKNSEVRAAIDEARQRGIKIDDYDAKVFLGAKEIFAADPKNQTARAVVLEYTRFLTTGQRPTSFNEFALPIFYTDEQIAEHERSRAAHLAYLAAQKNSSGEQRA